MPPVGRFVMVMDKVIRDWPARLGRTLAPTCGLLVALTCLTGHASAYAQVVGSAPAFIDVPVIGAHAAIVPLGVAPDGTMQAPTDPDTVGWYEPGTGVGAPGNALLDGHVDWGGRLRAFGSLKQLEPGDEIWITDTQGQVFRYAVSWTRLYQADTAPVDQIFAQTAAEEVTLITCGGQFDQSAHMYVSRWIVRAMRSDPIASVN